MTEVAEQRKVASHSEGVGEERAPLLLCAAGVGAQECTDP